MTGKTVGLDPKLIDLILKIEQKINNKLYITSGKRTKEDNKIAGGVSGSAHITGLAADICGITSYTKFCVVKAALELGIKRIGIDFKKDFVHIDIDPDKPKNVIWGYE